MTVKSENAAQGQPHGDARTAHELRCLARRCGQGGSEAICMRTAAKEAVLEEAQLSSKKRRSFPRDARLLDFVGVQGALYGSETVTLMVGV